MNPRMWAHPATQANVGALRARGVVLIGPDEGETAEGELGVGRMTSPRRSSRAGRELLAGNGTLPGKRVLVSAGGTREPIDAVRFVGNRSSGRMGVAVAEEARRRGAQVTLLGANLAVPAPHGVELVETPTAADLAQRGARPRHRRRRRRHGGRGRRLPAGRGTGREAAEGRRHVDGRARADDGRPRSARRDEASGQVLVGFAADQGERGLERAREARPRRTPTSSSSTTSRATGIGFDAADNEVDDRLAPRATRSFRRRRRSAIAAAILDAVEELLR